MSECDMIRAMYDTRHGGPFDRGAADNYYQRIWEPHYYVGDTGSSERIEIAEMTSKDIVAYTAGYNWNEKCGDKKEW
jgi:hypothetical protein